MSPPDDRRGFRTNDPGDAKVALMLGRIEEHMGWVKDALEDGRENFRLQSETIQELKGVAQKLTGTVDRVIEEQKSVAELAARVRLLENKATQNQPAIDSWKKISDAFLLAFVKWVLAPSVIVAALGLAANKAIK